MTIAVAAPSPAQRPFSDRASEPQARSHNLTTTFVGAMWSAHSAFQAAAVGGLLVTALLAGSSWLGGLIGLLLLWEFLHVGVGIGLMQRRPRARRAALVAMGGRVVLYLVTLPFQVAFAIESIARLEQVGPWSASVSVLLPIVGFGFAAVHLAGALYLRTNTTRAEFERLG